jgi:hypothetical protein
MPVAAIVRAVIVVEMDVTDRTGVGEKGSQAPGQRRVAGVERIAERSQVESGGR